MAAPTLPQGHPFTLVRPGYTGYESAPGGSIISATASYVGASGDYVNPTITLQLFTTQGGVWNVVTPTGLTVKTPATDYETSATAVYTGGLRGQTYTFYTISLTPSPGSPFQWRGLPPSVTLEVPLQTTTIASGYYVGGNAIYLTPNAPSSTLVPLVQGITDFFFVCTTSAAYVSVDSTGTAVIPFPTGATFSPGTTTTLSFNVACRSNGILGVSSALFGINVIQPATPVVSLSPGVNSITVTWTETTPNCTFKVGRVGTSISFDSVTSPYSYQNVTPGNYSLYVQASLCGLSTSNSATTTILPVAPSAFTAVDNGNTDVKLTWTEDTPGCSFNVSYANVRTTNTLLTGVTSPYIITNATVGVYNFTLVSLCGGVQSSPQTAQTTVYPVVPASFQSTVYGSTISLTWTESTPGCSFSIVSYPSITQSPSFLGNTATYNSVPGGTYRFTIVSVSGASYQSTTSAATSATVTLSPPSSFAATTLGNVVTLNWQESTPTASFSLSCTTAGSPFTTQTIPNGTLTATYNVAVTPASYTFSIVSILPGGTTSTAQTCTAQIVSTPTSFSAVSTGSTINLSWQEATASTLFTIACVQGGLGAPTAYSGNTAYYSGVTVSGTYGFTIYAYTSASFVSATASVSTQVVAPPNTFSAVLSGTNVNLTWNETTPNCTFTLTSTPTTTNPSPNPTSLCNASYLSPPPGSYVFSNIAKDPSGNTSTVSTTASISVPTPTPSNLTATSIDVSTFKIQFAESQAGCTFAFTGGPTGITPTVVQGTAPNYTATFAGAPAGAYSYTITITATYGGVVSLASTSVTAFTYPKTSFYSNAMCTATGTSPNITYTAAVSYTLSADTGVSLYNPAGTLTGTTSIAIPISYSGGTNPPSVSTGTVGQYYAGYNGCFVYYTVPTQFTSYIAPATIGTVTADGTTITVNWTDSVTTGIASYTVSGGGFSASVNTGIQTKQFTGASAGTSYSFVVSNVSGSIVAKSATSTSITPLYTPTIGTAVANGQSVTMNWSYAGSTTGITFTVIDQNNVTWATGSSPQTFTVTGTSYTFYVKASSGNAVATSAGVSVTPVPAPSLSSLLQSGSKITATYGTPASGTLSISQTSGPALTVGSTTNPFTFTGATGNTAYSFKAANTGTNASSTLTSSITTMGTPTNLSADAIGTATISAAWTYPTGAPAVTSYSIFTSTGSVLASGITTTACSGIAQTGASSYVLNVVAIGAVGTSISSAVSDSLTPITAPQITSATSTGASIVVTWNYTGTPAVTFKLMDPNQTTTYATGSSSTGVTAYQGTATTGLVAGSSYSFVVQATDANGDVAVSAASASVQLLQAPNFLSITENGPIITITCSPEITQTTAPAQIVITQTAPGTYSAPMYLFSGAITVSATLQGGGGGGGAGGIGNAFFGGGGGGAGYLLTTICGTAAGSLAYTIGAGGLGGNGASPPTSGVSGENTTITINGITFTASGGGRGSVGMTGSGPGGSGLYAGGNGGTNAAGGAGAGGGGAGGSQGYTDNCGGGGGGGGLGGGAGGAGQPVPQGTSPAGVGSNATGNGAGGGGGGNTGGTYSGGGGGGKGGAGQLTLTMSGYQYSPYFSLVSIPSTLVLVSSTPTSFVLSNAAVRTAYSFTLQNNLGTSTITTTSSFTTLYAPTNFTAANSGTTITAGWSYSGPLVGTQFILQSTDGTQYATITGALTTNFVGTLGTTYTLVVNASYGGNVSLVSSPATVVTLSPPSFVSVVGSGTNIVVTGSGQLMTASVTSTPTLTLGISAAPVYTFTGAAGSTLYTFKLSNVAGSVTNNFTTLVTPGSPTVVANSTAVTFGCTYANSTGIIINYYNATNNALYGSSSIGNTLLAFTGTAGQSYSFYAIATDGTNTSISSAVSAVITPIGPITTSVNGLSVVCSATGATGFTGSAPGLAASTVGSTVTFTGAGAAGSYYTVTITATNATAATSTATATVKSPISPTVIPGLSMWYDAADVTTIGFTPVTAPTVPNIMCWFDASDQTTLTKNAAGQVTQINDKSGNNYAGTGAVDYDTTTTKLMHFHNGQYLNLPQASINNASVWSMFFVIKPVNLANSVIMAKQHDGTNSPTVFGIGMYGSFYGFPASTTAGMFTYKSTNLTSPDHLEAAIITTSLQILSMVYNGTSFSFYVNGTLSNTITGSWPIINETSANNFILGNWYGNGQFYGNSSDFYLGELQLYSSNVNSTQQQYVEGYLAWKWGLQTYLPSTHTYNSPRVTAGPSIPPTQSFTSTTTNVGTWRDKSGNGWDTSVTTGTAPTYTSAGFNGNPGVLFNSGAYLKTQTLSPAPVLSYNGTDSSVFIVFNDLNNGAQVSPFCLVTNDNTFVLLDPFDNNSRYFGYGGTNYNTTAAYTAGPQLYSIVHIGSILNWYNFGSNLVVPGTQTGTLTGVAAQSFAIGANPPRSKFFNSYIGELIVYNRALNNTQRWQIESYLANKWGLQGSLSTNNPYKGITPPAYVAPLTSGPILWTDAADATTLTFQISPSELVLPQMIPQLSMWFDSYDVTTISLAPGTNNVTGWKDKSGNGWDTTATSGTSPTYSSTGFNNGYPGILFNEGAVLQTVAFSPIPTLSSNGTDTTVFVVLNPGTRTYNCVFSTVDENQFAMLSPHGATNHHYFGVGAWQIQDYTYSFADGPRLFSVTKLGSTTNWYNFGSLGPTSTTAGTVETTVQCFSIGGKFADTNYRYNSYISELIIYNYAMNQTQRQQIEGYLAWKWGLQVKLATGHPYASVLPPLYTGPLSSGPIMWYDASGTSSMTVEISDVSGLVTPTDFPQLSMWFDAYDDITVTTSDGVTVTGWKDKSGNGWDTTITSGTPPSYSSNGFNNGYPGILFNEGAVLQTVAFSPIPTLSSNGTDTTVFVVLNPGTRTYNCVFSTVDENQFAMLSPHGATNHHYFGVGAWQIQDYTYSFADGPRLFSVTKLGSTTNWYNFGSLGPTSTTAGTVETTVQCFSIGGKFADTNYRYNSYISELIIYNYALSTVSRQLIEGSLAWKWGLSSQLYTGHPWKSTPPVNSGQSYTPSTVTRNIINLSDKSGYNYTFTSNSISYPVYNPAVKGIYFGPNASFSNSYVPIPAGYTMLAIASLSSTPAGYGQLVNIGKTSFNGYLGTATGSTSFATAYGTGSAWTPATIVGNTPVTAIPTSPTMTLLEMTVCGTTLIPYFNASAMTASTGITTTSVTGIDIGGFGSLSNWTGYLHEFLLISQALSPLHRQRVEGYLAWRWGISGQLPATHLFRNASPIQPPDTRVPSYVTSNVIDWADKSGCNYTLTSNSVSYPVYNPAVKGIYFGPSASFSNSYVPIPAGYTMLAIASLSSTPAGYGQLVNIGMTSFNGYLGTATGSRSFATAYGTGSAWSPATIGANAPTTSIPISPSLTLLEMTVCGTTLIPYFNASAMTATAGTSTNSVVGIDIGGFGNLSNWTGYLHEFLLISQALSPLHRQRVEGYLAWRWGISGQLPATHLFRNASPIQPPDTRVPSYVTSNVINWADKSGCNYTLTSNSVSYPVYNPAVKGIYFGPNSSFSNSYVPIPAGYTMLAIASLSSTPAGYGQLVNIGKTSFNGYLGTANGSTSFSTAYGTGSAWTPATIGANTPATSIPISPSLTLLEMTVCGTTLIPYFNASAMTATTGTTTNSVTGIEIGGFANVSNWTGYLHEFLLISQALSPLHRQQVEGYLAWRWNIVSQLPSTHLFKNASPIQPPAARIPSYVTSNVINWADKSGCNYTLTSNSVSYPTYDANARGIFFGPNASFSNSYVPIPAGYTILAVASLCSAPTTYGRLVNVGKGDYNGFLGTYNTASAFATFTGSGTAWNDTASNTPASNVSTYSTMTLMEMTVNGSTLTPYINGLAMNTKTGTTIATTGIDIGGIANVQTWPGYLHEFLLIAQTLTPLQRQQVEGYLAWRWNLVSQLPANHLFKNTTPVSGSAPYSSNIQKWADKSGFGYTLTAGATGTGSTTYSYYGPGNAVQLSNSYMYVTNPVNLQTFALFTVVLSTSAINNQTVIQATPTSGASYNSSDGFGLYVDTPANPGDLRFYAPYSTPATNYISAGSTPLPLTMASYVTTASGLVSSWINGSSGVATTTVNNRTDTAQGFAIGAEWQGTAFGNIKAVTNIYEIITLPYVPTPLQRQQVEGYLAWKWGLQGSLPSTHAFKNAAP